MKPIKYELVKEPIWVDFKEIEEGYKMVEDHMFMPEFLEECYDEPNAFFLKSSNIAIMDLVNKKSEMRYIGSWRDESLLVSQIEYFLDDKGRLIAFLIQLPFKKKYFPSVGSVSIYVKEEEVDN